MSSIAVVVPIYNVETRLKACLDSLLNQTYSDIEIILIDDGSSDKSGSICDEYSRYDSRVRTVHITNSGVSAARNIGLKYVNSPYTVFVDSDDTVDLTLIEKMIKQQEEIDYDFVICGYKKVYYKSNNIHKIHLVKCKSYKGTITGFLNDIEEYLSNPLLQGPCWKLFKTSIIRNNNIQFPENLSYGEDASFVYKYLKYCNSIRALDTELYNYYVYSSNTLSQVFREDKYEINLLLVDELRELMLHHNITNKDEFLLVMICGHLVSYLTDIWDNRHSLSKSKIKTVICNAITKVESKKAFRILKDTNLQIKFLNIFIQQERPSVVFIYISIKEIIRRESKLVFEFLSKLKTKTSN